MIERDKLFLFQILESINKIEEYTEGDVDLFMTSTLIQDGVYRQFSVIGEAARRCDPETHKLHSHIDWKGVIGLRNIIIHQYDGVDPNEIWVIKQTTLVHLKSQLQQILKRNL